jgi:hypothetical protein
MGKRNRHFIMSGLDEFPAVGSQSGTVNKVIEWCDLLHDNSVGQHQAKDRDPRQPKTDIRAEL